MCHAGLHDFAAGLTPEELARTVRIPWFPDPPCVITVAEAMVQLAMHSQHHRGQCMTRLKDLGGAQPRTSIGFILGGGSRSRRPGGVEGIDMPEYLLSGRLLRWARRSTAARSAHDPSRTRSRRSPPQFDPQPFHLDETAAEASSFFGGLVGKRLAYGRLDDEDDRRQRDQDSRGIDRRRARRSSSGRGPCGLATRST